MGDDLRAEYLDAVARCALVAYNFQAPAPPPPVLAFTHSYTSDAKRLWLKEAGKQLAQDRDCPQLSMPSAASEYASSIGSSDQVGFPNAALHPQIDLLTKLYRCVKTCVALSMSYRALFCPPLRGIDVSEGKAGVVSDSGSNAFSES